MRTFLIITAASVLAAGLGGCATHSTPVAAPAKLTVPQRNFQAVWRASIDVLRKYHFTLDRQDPRAGVITTEPLLGQHFFEFWRGDAVTPFDVAESSIQTIYRTVVVKVRPAQTKPAKPKSTTYVPIVEVRTRRSNRESLGMISASDAYDLFILPGREESGAKKLMLGADKYYAAKRDRQGERIVRLGRYKNLAEKLTAEISQLAAKRLAKTK